MSGHSIRLNGPWQYITSRTIPGDKTHPMQKPVESGKFKMPVDWEGLLGESTEFWTLSRRFNMPTGLGEHDAVLIRFSRFDAAAQVYLNQVLLPIEFSGNEAFCQLSEQLMPSNLLAVVWDNNSKGSGPFESVRLEIESRSG